MKTTHGFLLQTENFCFANESVNRMKMLADHTSDKRLKCRICKEICT